VPTPEVAAAIVAGSTLTDVSQVVIGNTFTMNSNVDITTENGGAGALSTREIDANNITNRVESVQKKINTSRVQAGSQYAALESAVIYTTDLTAQYELGYNTVHDVNFSMETAHLAKNQILQQAATAMLAQANQGQQGLLQLIQG
jgi:flagellin